MRAKDKLMIEVAELNKKLSDGNTSDERRCKSSACKKIAERIGEVSEAFSALSERVRALNTQIEIQNQTFMKTFCTKQPNQQTEEEIRNMLLLEYIREAVKTESDLIQLVDSGFINRSCSTEIDFMSEKHEAVALAQIEILIPYPLISKIWERAHKIKAERDALLKKHFEEFTETADE